MERSPDHRGDAGVPRPAQARRQAPTGAASPAEVNSDANGEWVPAALAPVVAATYWLDPGERGKPFAVRIRFSGRRREVKGKPEAADRFEVVETVRNVLPGSGPVAVTARAVGVNAGEWMVSAEPVLERNPRGSKGGRYVRPADSQTAVRAAPSLVRALRWWGTPLMSASVPGTVNSTMRAFARAPGSITGAWPALVALGLLVGFLVQAILLRRAHLDSVEGLQVSLAAALAGLIGSKVWYLAASRKVSAATLTDGLCIQGFIAAVALVLVAGLLLFHLPIGSFLDASAPALFFGLVIGRPGCFLTGCCAGQPSASGWGLWASDQRLGLRRIPTQLWEALLALVVGAVTLSLVIQPRVNVPGAIALGGMAVYTLGRQLLFPFRAEPRRSSIGRPTTLAFAALVLATDTVCWAVTCI